MRTLPARTCMGFIVIRSAHHVRVWDLSSHTLCQQRTSLDVESCPSLYNTKNYHLDTHYHGNGIYNFLCYMVDLLESKQLATALHLYFQNSLDKMKEGAL